VWRKGKDAELIAWKNDEFVLFDQKEIKFNDLVDVQGYPWKPFGMGNVGIICLLQHKKTLSPLIVVCQHLHWNPKYDYVKYAQGFWLLKEISHFLQKN